MRAAPRAWLFALVVATITFKVWLSAVFPITGDEAYFIDWGQNPAPGYYDHPPMVGWWLALLLKLSDAPWLLRLPVTLLPAGMALGLYAALRGMDEQKAALAALALLLTPVHVWNVFITTDTPLAFFSFLSGLAFWRGAGDAGARRLRWFLLAGAFLGLALLSKYLAAVLGVAFLGHVLLSPRERRDWKGLAVTFAAALPFVAWNLYWNYANCWDNLMFNLYNRHDDAGLSWHTPLLYGLTVLYVLTPPALIAPCRIRQWRERMADDANLRLFVSLGMIPFVLFGLLSLAKQVGLHWVLSFVPFFFAACALLLERKWLARAALFAGVFSLVHILAIIMAAALPLERWQGTRLYDGIVFHFRVADVLKALSAYENDFELAADGYSAASTLSYYRGRHVLVFGEASSHARHDDIATDFRPLATKNIVVFRKSPPQPADYAPYFSEVEYHSFSLNGATFYLVLGRRFDFERYRAAVLAKVRDRYYRMPRYLPQGRCEFCERYFAANCPVR